MHYKIEQPIDPYSSLWALYWAQNPQLHRGVGADGVNDDGEGEGKSDDDGSKNQDKGSETPPDDEGEKNSDGDKGEQKGPSDTEAKLLKEVMQKKDKLKVQDSEIQNLKSELKKFDGIDLDQVQKLLKDAQDAETQKLEDKGEWDKVKAQIIDQNKTKLKEKDDRIAELEGQLKGSQSVIDKLTVGHAFDSSKFISDTLTLTPNKARIIYGDHFDIDGDSVVAYDKPRGASDRTPLVNAEGNSLNFEAAIQKIVDGDPDRDHIIKSKMKPGADSKTITGKTPKSEPELKGQSKIAAALNANKSGK